MIIWKQNINPKWGIWTNMICKLKNDGNLEIWKKDQGSTCVVTTTGVMTTQLGGGKGSCGWLLGSSCERAPLCATYTGTVNGE